MLFGQLEDFNEPRWVFLKPGVAGRGNFAAMDDIAFERTRPGFEPCKKAACALLLGQFLVNMSQEYASQAADPFGLQKIELHKAFNRAFAGPISEFHPLGYLPLKIEG